MSRSRETTSEHNAEGTRHRIHWGRAVWDVATLLLGGLIAAAAINLFIAPHDIAPGGASGLAIVITHYLPLPLGLTMLVINIPAYALGYRRRGGGPFLLRSLFATLSFNLGVDLMAPLMPAGGVTGDMVLNSIFGGVTWGIGVGLVYRAGGTAGAGGVTNRLLQAWQGLPIKVTSLYTNGAVIVLAGVVFGWEAAMYALISFYVAGTAADFVLEGPAVIRTALIITDKPDEVSQALMNELGRGVTRWEVQGMYTRAPHTALYCTVTRPQIHALEGTVGRVDPDAFVIVGQGQEALGRGFRELEPPQPAVERVPAQAEDPAGLTPDV